MSNLKGIWDAWQLSISNSIDLEMSEGHEWDFSSSVLCKLLAEIVCLRAGESQRLGGREERASRQRRHVEMEAELAAAALGVGRLL